MITSELVVPMQCQYQIKNPDGTSRQCNKPAISPTFPYCFSHAKSIGSPAKRGGFERYSPSMPDYVRTPYEHQMQDDSPQSLIPELANLRALINIYYEKIKVTLNEQGVSVMTHKDIATLAAIMEQIRRMSESQAKINPAKYIALSDMNKIVADIIGIIRAQIPAEHADLRERVAQALQKYGREEMSQYAVEGPQHEGS